MCNETALAGIFGQFAGREVALAGNNTADPSDPVLNDMQCVAKRNGYTLRLLWEDNRVTTSYDPKRANIRMEQHFDGKWCVSSHFHVG